MKTLSIDCTSTLRCAFIGMLILTSTRVYPVPIEGATNGIFVNPAIGPQSVVTGVGTPAFTWGTPEGTVDPNSLEFFGELFATDTELEDIITLGALD